MIFINFRKTIHSKLAASLGINRSNSLLACAATGCREVRAIDDGSTLAVEATNATTALSTNMVDFPIGVYSIQIPFPSSPKFWIACLVALKLV